MTIKQIEKAILNLSEKEFNKLGNCLLDLDYQPYLKHRYWIKKALELAEEAGKQGDVPVGAIIVDKNNKLIAQASNRRERDKNAIAHAEILAIQKASQILQNWHLNKCTLYVTLEPCPMCAGAIIQARIGRLVYGTDDFKTGSIRTIINLPDSACSNHRLDVIAGIMELDCRNQLQNWFMHKRKGYN
jgi:tRNA(adenine34) deaminase